MSEQASHIRRRPRPARRSRWYLDRSANGAEKTMCGASPTTQDMSWAETRWAKNRAYVTCEACINLRIEQGVPANGGAR
jgi:hypothetical protein